MWRYQTDVLPSDDGLTFMVHADCLQPLCMTSWSSPCMLWPEQQSHCLDVELFPAREAS